MFTFEEIRVKLKDRCVGIAGCGGLGSNCAVALARTGIGRLIVADFDTVSASNLNRQYFFLDQVGRNKALALKENIARIDSGITVEAHDIKLDPESILRLFSGCDIIVEAFDLAEMKHMIIETVLETMPGKPVIAGIGLAGFGNLADMQVRRTGNLVICGDGSREVSSTMPPLAPRVGIAANMQADCVLQFLLNDIPEIEEDRTP